MTTAHDPLVYLSPESVLQRAICHVGVDEAVGLSSSAETQQREDVGVAASKPSTSAESGIKEQEPKAEPPFPAQTTSYLLRGHRLWSLMASPYFPALHHPQPHSWEQAEG